MVTRAAVAEHKKAAFNTMEKAKAFKADETSEYRLKSGRPSPYFVNVGDLNTGASTSEIGKAYARCIHENIGDDGFDLIFGIPEKGVALAIATAQEYFKEFGKDKGWVFTRKYDKAHGEGSVGSVPVVGKKPEKEVRVVLLDDVFTTGETKDGAVKELRSIAPNVKIVGLVIAMDRQEVNERSVSAIAAFTEREHIPTFAIMSTTDAIAIKMEQGQKKVAERMATYLKVYGTKEARQAAIEIVAPETEVVMSPSGTGMKAEVKNGVIVACDMSSLELFGELVKQTSRVEGIVGYKIGFSLGLRYGLPKVVEAVRAHSTAEIIYDHQKAGTDIPDTGNDFAKLNREAGVNTIILFPLAGPETERAWIYRAYEQGLGVLAGGVMTHPAFKYSEGGFITNSSTLEIYRIAATAGVNRFVVPGTKPDDITAVKEELQREGPVDYEFNAPGFGPQAGNYQKVRAVLGNRWNAIVGRDIVNAANGEYGAAAEAVVKKLLR